MQGRIPDMPYKISQHDVINAKEILRKYELEKKINNDIGDIFI